jgi:hypothetical protein
VSPVGNTEIASSVASGEHIFVQSNNCTAGGPVSLFFAFQSTIGGHSAKNIFRHLSTFSVVKNTPTVCVNVILAITRNMLQPKVLRRSCGGPRQPSQAGLVAKRVFSPLGMGRFFHKHPESLLEKNGPRN